MSETRIKAWHFVNDDGRRAQDGYREVVGKTYHAKGPLVMCNNGMHASERLLDALNYAHGSRIRRVECWGSVERGADKLVCRHRKVLWEMDATTVLHEFACKVAAYALRRAKVTNKRCWNAIKVKRAWLRGKASDDELAAARAAAYAAYDAARDAAYDAARAAAWDAAYDAARAAARAAAWDAAYDAAKDKFNAWLEYAVCEAAGAEP